MSRSKSLLALGLVALLAVVAILGIFAGPGAGSPSMASQSGATEFTVPGNMAMSSDWKAQPVSGAPADVAWANIRVNNDATNEAQNEPFVAVNPSNARHIVVGANSWQVGNGYFEVFAYVTFDGGQTWSASQPYISRNGSRINAADPTVAFGSDGAVYFAFVALNPAQGAVAVSRSVDGGLTWASQSWATSFTSAADKPAIAFANGNLHLFYQNSSLYTRVSSNGGANWSGAALIEAGGRNAYPVVDNKGNLTVFYNTAGAIKMARPSVSNNRSSMAITTVADTVALQPRAAQYRANIYPAAGVDGKGNIYVAWADGRNAGMGNDILMSRSVDGGASWSAPARVNTDAGNADQLMPAVAVTKNGAVTISWLDTRNDAANVNYDVYMTYSSNGVNYGANERVSAVSSNPYNDPRTQGTMIGDYFALAAGSDGTVYAAWADTRLNNEDIYMAPITVASPTDN